MKFPAGPSSLYNPLLQLARPVQCHACSLNEVLGQAASGRSNGGPSLLDVGFHTPEPGDSSPTEFIFFDDFE
ncbi:MAG TPA: hypothetical protein VJ902_06585 [Wenzhouxiangellaceae bacterium]|nr:hypothetical protein [Wenzhouxiangellaceae bacterium]